MTDMHISAHNLDLIKIVTRLRNLTVSLHQQVWTRRKIKQSVEYSQLHFSAPRVSVLPSSVSSCFSTCTLSESACPLLSSTWWTIPPSAWWPPVYTIVYFTNSLNILRIKKRGNWDALQLEAAGLRDVLGFNHEAYTCIMHLSTNSPISQFSVPTMHYASNFSKIRQSARAWLMNYTVIPLFQVNDSLCYCLSKPKCLKCNWVEKWGHILNLLSEMCNICFL